MLASLITSNYYIMHTALSLFLILSNQNVQCGSVTGSNRVEANNRVLGSLDKTSSQKICKMLKGQIDRAYEQTDFSILRSVFPQLKFDPKMSRLIAYCYRFIKHLSCHFRTSEGSVSRLLLSGDTQTPFITILCV